MTTQYWPMQQYPKSHTAFRDYHDVNVTILGGVAIFWSAVLSVYQDASHGVKRASGRFPKVINLSMKTRLVLFSTDLLKVS